MFGGAYLSEAYSSPTGRIVADIAGDDDDDDDYNDDDYGDDDYDDSDDDDDNDDDNDDDDVESDDDDDDNNNNMMIMAIDIYMYATLLTGVGEIFSCRQTHLSDSIEW